jgi:hypothetical protein
MEGFQVTNQAHCISTWTESLKVERKIFLVQTQFFFKLFYPLLFPFHSVLLVHFSKIFSCNVRFMYQFRGTPYGD